MSLKEGHNIGEASFQRISLRESSAVVTTPEKESSGTEAIIEDNVAHSLVAGLLRDNGWKWFFTALAVAGIVITIVYVSSANRAPPAAQPVVAPAVIPFENYIGGGGPR